MNTIDQDNLINYRFSRRLGEQVPDAQYANPFELPEQHLRFGKSLLIALLVVAIIATLGVLA